jgi:MFS family permease
MTTVAQTTPQRADAPKLDQVQRRAVLANSGLIFLSITTGGMSADILQIYAVGTLHFTPEQIGLAFGLMFLSNPVQIWAARLPERIGKRRLMQAGYLGLLLVLVGFFFLSTVTSLDRTSGFWLMTGCIVAAEICIASSWGVAWGAWTREFAGANRAYFLSRMRLATQLVSTVAMLLVSVLLGGRISVLGYRVILAVLACYLLFAVSQFGKLPEAERTSAKAVAPGAVTEPGPSIKTALRDRRLWPVFAVSTLQMTIGFPLLASYVLVALHYPAFAITAAIGTRTMANLWWMGAWGRLSDRRGPTTVLVVTGSLLSLTLFTWVAMPAYAGPWTVGLLLLFIVAVQVLKSGFNIAFMSLSYDLIPEELSVPAFTVTDVLSSTTSQFYGLLAGVLITLSAGHSFPVLGLFRLDAYKLSVATGALICAAVTLWLRHRVPRNENAR